MAIKQLDVTLWDVTVAINGDPEDTLETIVGVIDTEGHPDWLDYSDIDTSVYFWMDNENEVKVGSKLDGDTVITEVRSNPYRVHEDVEVPRWVK